MKKTDRDAADVARIVYAALCVMNSVDVCDMMMNMRVVMHDMPADSQCRRELGRRRRYERVIDCMRCL